MRRAKRAGENETKKAKKGGRKTTMQRGPRGNAPGMAAPLQ